MGAERPTPERPRGSPNVDPGCIPSQGPVHEVDLGPFFISKYELTQGQYEQWEGENADLYVIETKDGTEDEALDRPVVTLTWTQLRRLLRRRGLDLPTEAQWEYAARGGTTTVWWTGNDKESLRGAANLADQAAAREGAPWPQIQDWPDLDDGYAGPAPAGTYRPNPFGLHEITGNFWEWCRDRYGPYTDPVEPGTGLRITPGQDPVLRGGSFAGVAQFAASANRNQASVDSLRPDFGARPARALSTKDYR
jgi:formylglycine-generating enzyme required for sulfatase activity